MTTAHNRVRIGILGASGYTGAELLRILSRHPGAEIRALTADRNAGQSVASVFPHLGGLKLPTLIKIDDVDWSGIDFAYCCLPHGSSQAIVARLPRTLKIVDLSADFRLSDPALYAQWYGHSHQAVDLQKEAVYGLTELMRTQVKTARLVANPGCYPTGAQLPLVPLLEAGQIDAHAIIIDSKSGVSGAGRAAKEAYLFTEVAEGIHPYGIAGHRHAPEIEQGLSLAARQTVTVTFTPHLMPMNRGILSTIYVRLAKDVTAAMLKATLERRYEGEPFVRIVPQDAMPATRHVRGSNHCLIGVYADRSPQRAIVVTAIDNLVKGASGQAVQNMNLMTGQPEATGLMQEALFP